MAPTRSTLRDVRRRNRSALLTTLFFNAPLSRQELSHLTGLSVATVGNVTGELIEERLVVEAGLVDSDGGRPRVLLRVDPNYGHLVGIDVGETGVKAELFDLTMGRLAAVEHPMRSPRPDPAEVVVQVTAALDQVVDEAGVDQQSVIGVGVGVPGTVEQSPRVRVHAQVIGWDAVPFEELVRAGGVGVPLFFDNGAKTQGQAELWFGAGRGASHAVVALLGSGVGAAVMTHGRTYQGATSSAGEWGHTTILYGGRQCRCGARGCLEAYVGAGIANLINLFNPERIVLGGWAGIALGEALLPRIRAAAEAHALRHPYGQTTIELCQLGPDAVAFGAATLPLAALLARGGLRGPAGGPGVPRSA